MKENELFTEIKNTVYQKSGDDIDWKIKVYDDEKVIRLLFEETTTKRDWNNNFNFPRKIYKNQNSCIKVARGWGDAYKSCNSEIMNELIFAILDNTDYQVEICGWSFGGAIAEIAVEDLYYRTKIKPNLITFGAPKALFGYKTRKYVRSCCNEIKQYSHKDDIVTLCPPLPFYFNLNKIKLGGKITNLINLFNPCKYHTIYDNENLYSEE